MWVKGGGDGRAVGRRVPARRSRTGGPSRRGQGNPTRVRRGAPEPRGGHARRGESALGPFAASETLTRSGKEIVDFVLAGQQEERVQDSVGAGRLFLLTGVAGSLPEAHAIQKGDRLYRAFHAKRFQRAVELRGLARGPIGCATTWPAATSASFGGPLARMSADFQEHLLLEARPG